MFGLSIVASRLSLSYIRFTARKARKVIHGEGAFFRPNSHPFQAIHTDDGVKRPSSSVWAMRVSMISARRGSSYSQGKRVSTSAKWRMSYPYQGILQLAEVSADAEEVDFALNLLT